MIYVIDMIYMISHSELSLNHINHHNHKNHSSDNGKEFSHSLELSKLEEIVEKPIDEMSAQEHWAIFFKYLTDKSKRKEINKIIELEEGIAMASELLKSISKDEIERARLMSEYKYQLDTQSKLASAERKGMEKGIKKGIKKGMKKGIEKGQNYVMELMAQGLSYEEIKKKLENYYPAKDYYPAKENSKKNTRGEN